MDMKFSPRWEMLQKASHHLQNAATYAVQAFTALGPEGTVETAYETLMRDRLQEAAAALGYDLVKRTDKQQEAA